MFIEIKNRGVDQGLFINPEQIASVSYIWTGGGAAATATLALSNGQEIVVDLGLVDDRELSQALSDMTGDDIEVTDPKQYPKE